MLSLLLPVCLPACDSRPADRTVSESAASPDGLWVATVVGVSGGGAAGYFFEDVLLTRTGVEPTPADTITSGTQLRGVSLEWLEPTRLRIDYSYAFRAGGKRLQADMQEVALQWREN